MYRNPYPCPLAEPVRTPPEMRHVPDCEIHGLSVPGLLVRVKSSENSVTTEFVSTTVTTKLLVALKGGAALSVTTVVSVFVLGVWAGVGVQVMIPFVSIDAPAGALKNE